MSDMVKASSEKALGLFEKAADTINTILKEDAESRILVNCFGGMSRSTTSVLAYLAIYEKIPADKALAQIKVSRTMLKMKEFHSKKDMLFHQRVGYQRRLP